MSFLTGVLGFTHAATENGWHRYAVAGGGSGRVLDVREAPEDGRGAWGIGSIHHLAWRVDDDEHQLELRSRIAAAGRQPTPVIDRFWFHSVYFREPGGVLFELATDGPGFASGRGPGAPRRAPGAAALAGAQPCRDRGGVAGARRAGAARRRAVTDLGFVHRFARGSSAATLLLLHGTGGDESDLLPLGRELAPQANLLSPRGQVLEHGMPRFFRRLAMGVFDEEDLRRRAARARRLRTARRPSEYGLDARRIYALGYSNGANIAAALLLLHPAALAGGALLRPVLPLEPEAAPDLAGKPVLLAAGRDDPYAPHDRVEALADWLRRGEAAGGPALAGGGPRADRRRPRRRARLDR